MKNIDDLARRLQKQDFVEFPTINDAKRFIIENPEGVIEYLIELIEQMQ